MAGDSFVRYTNNNHARAPISVIHEIIFGAAPRGSGGGDGKNMFIDSNERERLRPAYVVGLYIGASPYGVPVELRLMELFI